ncbi:hypothetical protein HK097_001910 [Rhizophlyctis rosea]|uniref:Uncharacterized protein n=1 Tax=Rhizophlyctis rosea TaxID=64517 RepID=A0AAD5S678_9FUNG|nr:hypothetical protein HK097_001910 [Rhizophlyctis rosea]
MELNQHCDDGFLFHAHRVPKLPTLFLFSKVPEENTEVPKTIEVEVEDERLSGKIWTIEKLYFLKKNLPEMVKAIYANGLSGKAAPAQTNDDILSDAPLPDDDLALPGPSNPRRPPPAAPAAKFDAEKEFRADVLGVAKKFTSNFEAFATIQNN